MWNGVPLAVTRKSTGNNMEATMTRVWTGATAAFAVACAAAVAAQTGGSQSDRDRTITVVGCLERGDQSPASTTGTSGTSTRPSSSARGEWILKNATMSPGGSSASTGSTTTTGTAGTTGTSTATEAGSGSTYILLGKSDELSKHAGHKIEITGKLDSSSGSASTGSTSGTTG